MFAFILLLLAVFLLVAASLRRLHDILRYLAHANILAHGQSTKVAGWAGFTGDTVTIALSVVYIVAYFVWP